MSMCCHWGEDDNDDSTYAINYDTHVESLKKSYNDGLARAQLLITRDLDLGHRERTRLWDELENAKWK